MKRMFGLWSETNYELRHVRIVYFYFLWVGWDWVHLVGTSANIFGLLYQPKMSEEQSVDWLTEKAEVLGENLLQRHFVHHRSHMT
jgi:hypothetical protein